MKRTSLSKLLVASALAGLSIVPTPKPAQAGAAAINPAPKREQVPSPMPTAKASAANLASLVGGDVFGLDLHIKPFWPHNRPLPGWRKVQSRARHAERMRRIRRNA